MTPRMLLLFVWLLLAAVAAIVWALAAGGPLIDRAAAELDGEDSFDAHCAHPSVGLHEWSPFAQSDQDWLDSSGTET
jgi:hypothetical protein